MSTISGIIGAWVLAWRYYKKGSKQIDDTSSLLESLTLAGIRISQDIEPKEGKLIKTKDGKYVVQWNRKMSDNVTFNDEFKVVKKKDNPKQKESIESE
jgi:hypothetical protein